MKKFAILWAILAVSFLSGCASISRVDDLENEMKIQDTKLQAQIDAQNALIAKNQEDTKQKFSALEAAMDKFFIRKMKK
jgi:outer membrane murein-binding lipoprotein Lpp